MKLKATAVLIFALFTLNAGAQYKDLEGVFLGKVIALGAGGGYVSFRDHQLPGTASITPFIYEVLLSNKKIVSFRYTFNRKLSVTTNYNDYGTEYTYVDDFKTDEIEFVYKFSITKGGLEKPVSLFADIHAGTFSGRQTTTTTDQVNPPYTSSVFPFTTFFAGAGLSGYKRIGKRFLLFAESSYKLTSKALGNEVLVANGHGNNIGFSHIDGRAGLLFLIGKSS